MSRAVLAAMVRERHERGMTYQQIGAELGISRSHANAVVHDPDGSKDRERKQRYGGTCESCGAPTDGSNGAGKAPRFCHHCIPDQVRKWTAETVTEAIRTWARLYGRPPTADQWLHNTKERNITGYEFPYAGSCYRGNSSNPSAPFESWADAIEAAGFPRPRRGHKTKGNPPVSPSAPKATRTYLVFRHTDTGHLEIIGEAEAHTNQEAVEEVAEGAGRFAAVAKGSLQTFTLAPRLVASREVDGSPVDR